MYPVLVPSDENTYGLLLTTRHVLKCLKINYNVLVTCYLASSRVTRIFDWNTDILNLNH